MWEPALLRCQHLAFSLLIYTCFTGFFLTVHRGRSPGVMT